MKLGSKNSDTNIETTALTSNTPLSWINLYWLPNFSTKQMKLWTQSLTIQRELFLNAHVALINGEIKSIYTAQTVK
ncbi:MAG: hypothetical protein DRI97_00065 [Bacteroidetes bacterium]|nr:MAG: hypothetical protein DRI97_00065 [Bacteroidota bacterium]